MILAIDGYEANARVRVGVGRFAVELLTHMHARIASGQTCFSEARVYIPGDVKPHMPKKTPFWRYHSLHPTTLWTFWSFPIALRRERPRADVVFSPTHYIPRFTPIPKVMAIMDVSYLSYPEMFRPADLHKLVHWTAYAAGHAKAIITISEFSKNAIIKAYRVPESRVTVAYPALSGRFTGKGAMANNKTRHLPKRYILSVGTIQPRKNYSSLIEAFSRIEDRDISLVIVGKKGWLYDDILAAPERFGVSDRVKFLDFVDDSELLFLYKHAVCFALVSLYEGFGLPVLEAMVHGVPVVVSSTSSLPEIAGMAGIYVDPDSVASIAEGLRLALSQEGTGEEKKRIALGKSLAKRFSWESAAEKVLDVLTTVGRGGAS